MSLGVDLGNVLKSDLHFWLIIYKERPSKDLKVQLFTGKLYKSHVGCERIQLNFASQKEEEYNAL